MSTERNLHVLLFDPDLQAASPLVRDLESVGHRVTYAAAWETQKDLSAESYDVMVMAWTEPNISPFQTAPEWLRRQSSKCPLILAVASEQLVKAAYFQSYFAPVRA